MYNLFIGGDFMGGLGNKETMAKNIQYYLDLHDKTRNEICNDLSIKYSTFTDWVNGNTYPRIDKIERMANYFNIQKSDLVEEKTETQKEQYYYINEETRQIAQGIFDNKDMRILFDVARDTSPEHLRAYAQFLKQLQNKND